MSETRRLSKAIKALERATRTSVEKLAEAAEAGRLVILPCAVGDTVYCLEQDFIPCMHDSEICPHSRHQYSSSRKAIHCPHTCPDRFFIEEHKVQGFEYDGRPLQLCDAGEWGCEGLEHFPCQGGVFLSREEAEKELERK